MNTFQSTNEHLILPLPAPELSLLNVFVGSWHVEGDSYSEHQSDDNSETAVEKWTSEDRYEWMPGNYYLVHRWDATVGGRPAKGMEIIGYDVHLREFFTRMFDPSGNAIKYRGLVEDNIWQFIDPFTRSTLQFSNNNNTMTSSWEWRQEAGDWLPLSNRIATRFR